jgi:hypothetical protein
MNPIEALMTGDVATFRAHVNDTLMAKLSDRLDQERVAVAASMFAPAEEQPSSEETGEEEMETEDQ